MSLWIIPIPEGVFTLTITMEVLMIGSVESVQPVENVLACVGVDDIKENGKTHAVRGVDKFLQFFRCTVS